MKTKPTSALTGAIAGLSALLLQPSASAETVIREWVQLYDFCQCGENEAQRIGLDKKENIYVGGYSAENQNDSNWAVVKYSPTGVQLWQARYGGVAGGFDALYDMKVHYDTGDVYAAGKSIENGSPYSVYTTIKWNKNGAQQWVVHYNG